MCAFRLSTLDKYFKMSQAGTKMLNHMRNFSRIHSTLSQIFQRRQQLIWKLKCKLEGWEWNVHCMWSRKKNRHDTLLPVTGAKINETVLLLFFISLVDLLFYLRRPAKTSVNNEKTYMRFSYTFVWDCACVCVCMMECEEKQWTMKIYSIWQIFPHISTLARVPRSTLLFEVKGIFALKIFSRMRWTRENHCESFFFLFSLITHTWAHFLDRTQEWFIGENVFSSLSLICSSLTQSLVRSHDESEK